MRGFSLWKTRRAIKGTYNKIWFTESDVKEKVQSTQRRLYQIVKKKGVAEKSDIKWIFLEEFGKELLDAKAKGDEGR